MNPKVCVLRTDGTNCDKETAYAFERAGGLARLVHVNELRDGSISLERFQILVIPGGFSYGDDMAAGRVLASEMITYLGDQLWKFVEAGRPVLGICNGFQVLARTGLLPFRQFGEVVVRLTDNDSGRFECRWVKLAVAEGSPCVFTQGLDGQRINLPVAHGEGKFVAKQSITHAIERQNLWALTYASAGIPMATEYPANPNGSLFSIAGLCDPTGRILGLMPHPERYVDETQHPNWRRFEKTKPHGLAIFENAVRCAADL